MAIYGVIFFCLNFFYYDLPKNLKNLYLQSYTFLEYFFLAFLLWSSIPTRSFIKLTLGNKIFRIPFKNFFFIFLSVFFYGFLIYHYSTTKIKTLDTIPIGIESILIFSYIFYFFFEHFSTVKDQYIYNHPCFWIIAGILIYLGGSFFFNLLYTSLSVEMKKYWFLTYITESIKNLFFVYAMIMYVRHFDKKSKKSTVPNLDFSLNK